MYRLLIVDDESIEREALKFILKRSEISFDEIIEASNGQEAISIFAVSKPHIVIMDIKMPGINGIEAAKVIKKIDPDSKIIFQTAFDQFDYAHEAIKLGVEDFIVKPSTNQNIIDILNKTICDLEKDFKSKGTQKDMENKLNKVSRYLESEFVMSIVIGEIDEEQAMDYFTFFGTTFYWGFGVVIKLWNGVEQSESYLHSKMVKKRFFESMIDTLKRNNIKCIGNLVRGTIYILIVGISKNNKESYYGIFKKTTEELLEKYEERYRFKGSVGVGKEYSAIGELWKSFSEAKIECYEKLDKSENDNYYESMNEMGIKLSQSIIENDEESMLSQLNNELDRIIYASTDINEIRFKIYELIISMNKYIYETIRINKGSDKLIEGINEIHSIADAKSYVQQYFVAVIAEINSQKTDKTGVILDKVIKYMKEHYSENISLEKMAMKSGFSIYHFCKIFKKYYNMNFKDYLSVIRIENAKKMLAEPKLSIKDISASIGYTDPNYFTRVFKKYEGITPTEYRNNRILM